MNGFPFNEFFGGMGGGFEGHGHHRRGDDDDEEEPDKLYKVLGVDKNCSNKEIKRAFRKLAQTHHPDRGGDEEKFKELQTAYEILSNEQKRRIYDRQGMMGLKGGDGGGGMDIFDIFNRGNRRARRGREKNHPIKKELWITLKDVYFGPTAKIEVKAHTADSGGECPTCGGRGSVDRTIRRGMMIIQQQVQCSDCEGKGASMSNKRLITKKVAINIPKGVQTGQTIKAEGAGHSLPGKDTGDVVCTINVAVHPIFEREGADLVVNQDITLTEAMCGFEKEITHISGTILKYKSPTGCKQGGRKMFEGWGLPQLGGLHGMEGNMIMIFNVVFPVPGQLDDEAMVKLQKVFKKTKWQQISLDKKNSVIQRSSRVKLVNLNNFPDLNGKIGTVMQETRRGWAVKLDQDGRLVSVPENKLKNHDDKKMRNKRKAKFKNTQKENDYEEEVVGKFYTVSELKITPSAVEGSATNEDEAKQEGMRGRSCQQM